MVKGLVYGAILKFLKASGAMHRAAAGASGRATLLAYHGVTERPSQELDAPDLHLPISIFRRQMELLATRFRVVPLPRLVEWIRDGADIPARTAIITLDDGYANNVRCALPILRELELPACMFVTAGLVGTSELHWTDILRRAIRELPEPIEVELDGKSLRLGRAGLLKTGRQMKNAEDSVREHLVASVRAQLPADLDPGEGRVVSAKGLRQWHDAGMTVGSHTLTHPILSRVSEKKLEHELAQSREILEGIIGEPVTLLAYPNGLPDDYDAGVIEAARAVGYGAGMSSIRTQADIYSPLFEIPRYIQGRSTLRMEARLSGWEERLQKLRGR